MVLISGGSVGCRNPNTSKAKDREEDRNTFCLRCGWSKEDVDRERARLLEVFEIPNT